MKSILKKYWKTVHLIIVLFAILVLILGFVINPHLVKHYLSSDRSLEAATVRRIIIFEVLSLATGFFLLYLSKRIKAYSDKKADILSNVLMICASITFALVLIEAGLKVVQLPLNQQRHAFFQYDKILGWKHKPGKKLLFKNTTVHISAQGLRDDAIAYPKPGNEFRILFLGDSQLFGDGVNSEETFVDILENQLQSVQAINAGVIGYGTDQQYLFLKNQGVKYSPDVVIVTLNAYDFKDNISKEIRSGYNKPIYRMDKDSLVLANVPVPNFDLMERFSRFLKSRSHLYYIASSGLKGIFNNKSDNEKEQFNPEDVFPDGLKFNEAIAITTRILSEIIKLNRSINANTVILFLPYEIDFKPFPDYESRVDHLCRELKNFSSEKNVHFCDIRPQIASKYNPDIFLDTMHFSPSGNKLVAEILLSYLTQYLLIPSSNISKNSIYHE